MPTYPHEKVISLADITMYSDHGDVPLPEIMQKLFEVENGQPVDIKALASDADYHNLFAQVLPDYDRDRVYTSDLRKLFTWYNELIAAGVTDFKDNEIAQDEAAEAAEAADDAQVK